MNSRMASLNSGARFRILGDWPRIQKEQTVNAKRSSPHSPACSKSGRLDNSILHNVRARLLPSGPLLFPVCDGDRVRSCLALCHPEESQCRPPSTPIPNSNKSRRPVLSRVQRISFRNFTPLRLTVNGLETAASKVLSRIEPNRLNRLCSRVCLVCC